MIKDLILKGSQALDDVEGFTIDRAKYMNASTATSCIRKQWYERNVEAPPQDWGFARRGKQGELYLVDCLRAAGAAIVGMGDEQVSLVSERYPISATPDGYIELDGVVHQVEFKTIDPRANRKYLPKPAHVTQLQIGMEISQDYEDDVDPPVAGLLVYMDASNYNDILVFDVPRDPLILKRLAPRAEAMLKAKGVDRLDREGRRTGECKLYGGCPFAEQCGVDLASAKVDPSDATLEEAARAYAIAKGDEAAAKDRKDDAAETIKKRLREMGKEEAVAGNHRVALSYTSGRTSVNWKQAEKDGLDLEPYKTVGKPSERLTVE